MNFISPVGNPLKLAANQMVKIKGTEQEAMGRTSQRIKKFRKSEVDLEVGCCHFFGKIYGLRKTANILKSL